jgi:hypothetical protein
VLTDWWLSGRSVGPPGVGVPFDAGALICGCQNAHSRPSHRLPLESARWESQLIAKAESLLSGVACRRARECGAAQPTIRSAEGRGSRLSRRGVGRSGAGGRGGQQQGRSADQPDLDREICIESRRDEQRELHAQRDSVGDLRVTMILGIVRSSHRRADRIVGCPAMMLRLVYSLLVEAVVCIAMRERDTGGGESHQYRHAYSDSPRRRGSAHGVNVERDPSFGEKLRAWADRVQPAAVEALGRGTDRSGLSRRRAVA